MVLERRLTGGYELGVIGQGDGQVRSGTGTTPQESQYTSGIAPQ